MNFGVTYDTHSNISRFCSSLSLWMFFFRLNSAATNSEIMYYDYAFGMLKLEGMKE